MIVAMALAACSPGDDRGSGDEAAAIPDVLLITLDTFRADRAGCMGHPGRLTPALDRIARRGVLARNAFAPAPLTAVSHASILTGLRPPAHGVRENWFFRLPDTVPTLATRLQAAGYRTGGFIAGFPLKRRFGFAQGFDTFDDRLGASEATADAVERPGELVVRSALSWVRSLAPRSRWFMWAHFFDPHYPWDPHPPLDRHPAGNDYDREIVWTDLQVRRLLRGLEAADDGPLLIALATDHGEGLGGHGELTHGVLLYQEMTRAIFCIAAPAGNEEERALGSGIRGQVTRLTDIAPTLLALLGLEAEDSFDGCSILQEAEQPLYAYAETYYPEFHFDWSPLHSLRTSRWSYIESPEPELFDLRLDPGETRNVLAENPQVAAEFACRLAALTVPPRERAGDEVGEQVREQLMSLGYVAGSVSPEPGGARGKDPKKLVSTANAIFRGITSRAQGDLPAALQHLQRAYRADPENKTVLYQLANCHRDMGQLAMAHSYYRRAIQVNPQAAEAYMELAALERGRGRTEEAFDVLDEGLEHCPHNVGLLVSAGDLHREVGLLAEAREHYEAARDVDPHDAEPWIGLAELAEQEGREQAAEDAWREVARIAPHDSRLPERFGSGS
jgi:arylsulfatase A-like enzyme/Tfp pilus assembly protein PilF